MEGANQPGSSTDRPKIFHERQSWAFCALHALNNLMQREAFTRNQLDAICCRSVVITNYFAGFMQDLRPLPFHLQTSRFVVCE